MKKNAFALRLLLLLLFLGIFGPNWWSPLGVDAGPGTDSIHSVASSRHSDKRNVLVVAQNRNPSHFQFQKKLALILREEPKIDEVYILIWELGNKVVMIEGMTQAKRLKTLTDEEHVQVEDRELAAHIGAKLKVAYFDGQNFRLGVKLDEKPSSTRTLTKKRSKSKSPSPSGAAVAASKKSSSSSRSRSSSISSKSGGVEGSAAAAARGRSPEKKTGTVEKAASSKSRSKSPSEKPKPKSNKSPSPSRPKVSEIGQMWKPRDHGRAKQVGNLPTDFKELSMRDDVLEELKKEKFTIGLAEVWDSGAFFIFEALEIPRTVATSAMPSQSIFYAWMDESGHYLNNLVNAGVPELWTAPEKEPHFNSKKHTLAEMHKMSIDSAMQQYRNHDNLYCAGNEIESAPKKKKKSNRGKFFSKIVKACKKYLPPKKGSVKGKAPAKDAPLFEGFFKKVKFYLVNTQPIVDYALPTPYPHQLQFIGGITIPESDGKLSAEEEKIVHLAAKAKGLIYFSLGSQLKTNDIPAGVLAAFLKIVEEMEHDYVFLWKLDDRNGLKNVLKKAQPANLHVMEWVNQPALLGRPETKLFISHCGINSVLEAAKKGVPLLCMPISADQFYNAGAIHETHGAAEVLDKTILVNDGAKEEGAKHVREHLHKALGHAKNMEAIKHRFDKIHPKRDFLAKMIEL